MVIHRRSESSDNLLCPVSSAQVEMSTEFKNKLSVHGKILSPAYLDLQMSKKVDLT